MKKLSKKTFQPDLEVIVIDTEYSVQGMKVTEFEAYPMKDIKDLAVYPASAKLVFKRNSKLVTVKLVNHGGSPRAIFRILGHNQLFQAFWCDFATFTRIE